LQAKTKFGSRLKELREEANLSLEQLAERFGTSRQVFWRYENNQREPEYEILVRIADYFGVSIDYLLGRANERK
jgi:transcriptional regulator with XRE-family HTH domain